MERTRTPRTQGMDLCAAGLEVLAAVAVKQAELSVFVAAVHSVPPSAPFGGSVDSNPNMERRMAFVVTSSWKHNEYSHSLAG